MLIGITSTSSGNISLDTARESATSTTTKLHNHRLRGQILFYRKKSA